MQGDVVEFVVTLRNPFMFDLHIDAIEVRYVMCAVAGKRRLETMLTEAGSTSGASFSTNPVSATIAPSSFQSLRLSGTPQSPGTLIVRGCRVRLASAEWCELVLPIPTAPEQGNSRHSKAQLYADRLKSSGLDLWRDRRPVAEPPVDLRYWQCRVVPHLPLLRLVSTSLTHGAIMLYEGERRATVLAVVDRSARLTNALCAQIQHPARA